jgi:putative transposase
MHEWQSLSHVRWDCKYHVVIVPKCRKKLLFGKLRRQIGPILRELCQQKGVELLEGHAMPDHIHMCLAIPPKYSVAYTIGFLKGKSAIRIHRQYERSERVYGKHFWAVGYCVSTIGLDEEKIRKYIREQEKGETDQNMLDFDQD